MRTKSRPLLVCAAVGLLITLIVLRWDVARNLYGPLFESDAPRQAVGVVVPDARGDAVVLDHDAGHVRRRNPAGEVVWRTPLDGHLGLVRPPHLVVDAARAYVTHADGVTALDVTTGALLWHSSGPSDRLLLSRGLLFATECGNGEEIEKDGRWVTARDPATGAERFRVPLPAERFDPLPLDELAGLVLVQKAEEPDGPGLGLLLDHAGRVRHRFDRQVVTVRAVGKDLLALTSRDVVRLSERGEVRWSAPLRHGFAPAGGFVDLPGGDVVAFLYCAIADSGVEIVRLDPASGAKVWAATCESLRVTHSGYNHVAEVGLTGRELQVTSGGSGGTFIEVLDADTGRQLKRDTNMHGGGGRSR